MSFILEALRKAERERNLGQVPALRIAAAPGYPARRGFSPGWIAVPAVLAGGAIGAAGWWQSREAPGPETVAAAPPPSQATPMPEPVAPPTERVEVQTPQGLVEMELPPAPSSSAPAPQPLPELPTAPEDEPPVAAMQETLPFEEPDAAPDASDLPALEAPPSEEVPMERIGPETAELPPEQPLVEDLPSYNGLPESLRSAIPQLNMNAHVYSSTPGRGFVMINGKKYRQGDKLAEGPEVVHILPDSVVLNYRGTDFLLPVPR